MDKDALNQNWLHSNGTIATFLRARLFRDHFTGRSLTYLLGLILIALMGFFSITAAHLYSNWLHTIDVTLTNVLVAQRSQASLEIFYGITLIAQAIVIIPAAIVFGILLALEKKYIHIFAVGFTLSVSHSATALAKLYFMRVRPLGWIPAITEHSYAYPSGHATAAMAFYGFIAYVYVRSQQARSVKVLIVSICAIVILLVDLSRIYLGIHYLSDVLAGNLVGLLFVLLAISSTEWFLCTKSPTKKFVTLRPFIVTLIATSVYIALVVALSASPFIEQMITDFKTLRIA